MKKNKIVLLVMTAATMLSCNEDSANTLSFEDTVTLMESNPKQFLSKLDTATVSNKMEDEDDATAFLLKSMCDNYINENVFPPTETMKQCALLLTNSDDNAKQMESLLLLAKAYHHDKMLDHEICTINKALALAQDHHDNKWIFYLYSHLGEIYFYEVDLIKYAEYLNQAKEFYDSEDTANLDIYSQLLIGKTNIFNSEYDKAIKQLKNVALTIGESHAYFGYSHYLLGIAYFKTGNWELCIRHTLKALPKLQRNRSLFMSYSMLTYCYYSTNKVEEAENFKKLALHHDTFEENSFIEIEFYRICADFAEKRNETEEKMFYLNRVMEVYKHKLRSLNEKTLNQAMLKYEFYQKRKEYNNRINSYKLAVTLLAVALLIFTWIYRNKKKQQAYRLMLLQEQVKKLEAVTGTDNEVREMILRDMEIARRISYLKYSANDKGNKLLQEIEKLNLLNGNKLLNTQWNDFFRHIDIIFDGFYSKLTEKYSSLLGDKEIQLCCMLIAGFRSEEIAAVWGQSIYTVHKCKTTVRKKIASPEGKDLISYLKEKLY